MLAARSRALIAIGVNVIVLLALSDDGPARLQSGTGWPQSPLWAAPVFACTPDQFPSLMAAALRRQDLHAWAATEDIKLVRPVE